MADGRKLRILLIEDREKLSRKSDFERYLKIDACIGVKTDYASNAFGALDLLAEYHRSDPRPTIDVLLVDVDMSNDPALRGWHEDGGTPWDSSSLFRLAHQAVGNRGDGTPRDLAPFGPIIALPFLSYASSLFTVQQVSAYWDKPAVYNNGYFLVSMALICTVSHLADDKESIPPEDVRRDLRNGRLKHLGVSDRGGGTPLQDALGDALQAIRDRLPERFYFLGLEPAIERIASTLRSFKDGHCIRADLIPAVEGLGMDLQSVRDNTADRIDLASLFADALVVSGQSAEGKLDRILTTLEAWAADERTNMHPLVRRLRSEVMDQIRMPDEEGFHETKALKLLDALRIEKESAQFLAARRFVTLMAWTRGWYHYLLTNRHDVRYWALCALGIYPDSPPNEMQRLLFWKTDAPDYVRQHRYRYFLNPFRYVAGASPKISDYYLDEAEGSELRLNGFDQTVCRHYLAHLQERQPLPPEAAKKLPSWLRQLTN